MDWPTTELADTTHKYTILEALNHSYHGGE